MGDTRREFFFTTNIKMKEKILSQLIAMCKDLTGVSPRTLDVLATSMALTVTEESQIEAAVLAQKPILESFQGNLHSEAKKAVDTYKEAHPENKPAEKTPAQIEEEAALEDRKKKGLLTMEDVRKIMDEELGAKIDEKLNPITKKLTVADDAKALNEIKDAVLAKIKKEYSFNLEETKRVNMAMQIALLKNGKPASAEDLQAAWENEYNTISSDLGLSSLKPFESGGENNGVSSELAEFKKKQQAKGKLPKDESDA